MQRSRVLAVSIWTLIFLTVFLLFSLTAAAQDGGKGAIKVMTYNVNEGTDFLEVLSATNLDDFRQAVAITLNNIESTNPPLRMQAVAKEIAQTEPDLVGLQEVTTWSVGGEVKFDMLQELLSALDNLGEHYVVVVKADEFQLAGQLPDLTVVQGADYDVILARADAGMEFSNIQKAHFSDGVLLTLPTAVGPFTIARGWASVDVLFHGQSFRFIVSHLEQFIAAFPATVFLQEGQAFELIAGPGSASMPVIIAVDTNADALGGDDSIATYLLIRSLGFGDAWAAVHPDQPGATWGFMQDANDPRPTVRQRIDYVFFNSESRALTAQLAGQREQEKVDGLWPSDHVGVRAGLLVSPE